MLNYDDLTPEQKLIIDYRVKKGYYKRIVIGKENALYAEFNEFLWIWQNSLFRIYNQSISSFFFIKVLPLGDRKLKMSNKYVIFTTLHYISPSYICII